MAVVLTNLPKSVGGVQEPQRYVDVIVGSDGKERLCVDALLNAGEITIGGVYIYDYNSGLGADVIPTGEGNNGLVVVVEEEAKAKVVIYSSALIAAGSTLTLSTYTVPTGKKFTFTGAMVGGGQEGKFNLKMGGATVAMVRTSGSLRTIINKFPSDPEASAGAVIDIVAENIGDLSKTFETTLFGHTVDA